MNLKTNLKTYNSILRRNINFAKQHYYHTRFEKCKLDIKNTWVIIKEIINHEPKKSEFPQHFLIDGRLEANRTIIADNFNTFFATIGTNLASNISNNTNKTFRHFLRNPSADTFAFHSINVETVERIISQLPNPVTVMTASRQKSLNYKKMIYLIV